MLKGLDFILKVMENQGKFLSMGEELPDLANTKHLFKFQLGILYFIWQTYIESTLRASGRLPVSIRPHLKAVYILLGKRAMYLGP